MPATQTPRKMTPRELDALRKRILADQAAERKRAEAESWRQLTNDIKSGINDILGRGVIAPALGAPADVGDLLWNAGAWINNRIKDFEAATGLVDKPRYVQYRQGNAYLGSEDIGNRMQQAGLVSPTRRPNTELAASLVSPGAAVKTVVNAPRTAMNMLRVADRIEAPARALADTVLVPSGSGYVGRTPQIGAIENLWHGSPHTFDRFDLSKVGTGEGAQAYGYGAYLAEGKGVAETYKKDLSGFDELTIYTKDGKKKGQQLDDVDLNVAKYLELGERMAGQFKHNTVYYAKQAAQKAGLDDVVARLDKYGRDAKVGYEKNTGNLYQTRLAWPDPAREAATPLKPEDFLDWDKPLSEQSDFVRNTILQSDLAKRVAAEQGIQDLNYLGARHFESPENSAGLRDLGIPGIRYLDAGSRPANVVDKRLYDLYEKYGDVNRAVDEMMKSVYNTPKVKKQMREGYIKQLNESKQTRNYVVFDDKLIDIVARNNQPITKAAVPSAKKQLFVTIGGAQYPVADMLDAARKYQMYRQQADVGASMLPPVDIVDESGNVIANFSYNGRLWKGERGAADRVEIDPANYSE